MLNDDCMRTDRTRKIRFAKVPDFLQTDARLVGCDLRLLARLIHYAWGSGVCWPSIGRLAAELSLAERTIQAALKRLYGLGYVSTRPAANPTGREFVLHLGEAQPTAPPSPRQAAPPSPPPAAPEADAVPSSQTHEPDGDRDRPVTKRQDADATHPHVLNMSNGQSQPPGTATRQNVEHRPTAPTERPLPPRRSRMTGMELASMTRALAAAGDPAAQRELARLERPMVPPLPTPGSAAELIERLDDDPTFRPRLAAALADLWGDRKSYEFYWQVAMREPRDAIARAFAGCRGANSPPAMFTALLRRDPESSRARELTRPRR